MRKKLTYERLVKIVKYSPRSGKFFWILRDQRKRNIIILKHSGITGWMYLCLYGKWYPAQEIAYLFQKGKIPTRAILFKNKCNSDFRWDNLKLGRDLSRDPEIVIYSMTNVSGIMYNKEDNIWKVDIYSNKKKIRIGYYHTFKQAVRTRWEAEKTFKFPGRYTTSEAFKYLTNHDLI